MSIWTIPLHESVTLLSSIAPSCPNKDPVLSLKGYLWVHRPHGGVETRTPVNVKNRQCTKGSNRPDPLLVPGLS